VISTFLQLGLALACIAGAGVILIRLFDRQHESSRKK
jgi:hypothetical protein